MAIDIKRLTKHALAYALIFSCCYHAGEIIKSSWATTLGAIVGVAGAMFIAEISLLGTLATIVLISIAAPLLFALYMNSTLGISEPLSHIITRVPIHVLIGPLIGGILTFLLVRHLTNRRADG